MSYRVIFIVLLFLPSISLADSSKTILLKSHGSVLVQPDEASFSATINCLDKDLSLAQACIKKESDKLTKELKAFGVKKKDILTTRVNLSKDFKWRNNTQVFNGYRASLSTQATVRDLVSLGDLYAKLMLNQNLTLSALSYARSDIAKYNKLAYSKALENAKSLADTLLSGLPESKKEIMRVSNIKLESGTPSPVHASKMVLAESADGFRDQSISINTGDMYVEKMLFVEFRIF